MAGPVERVLGPAQNAWTYNRTESRPRSEARAPSGCVHIEAKLGSCRHSTAKKRVLGIAQPYAYAATQTNSTAKSSV